MAGLLKDHRKPGWKHKVSGFVDEDRKPDILAEGQFDSGSKYRGQWHHGVYQGAGVYELQDGQRCRGLWLGSKRHGMGVHRWPDTQRYEGEYKDDKKHGLGVMFYASGNMFHGEYRNEKRVCGVFALANGSKALIKFDDDGKEIDSARITGTDVRCI